MKPIPSNDQLAAMGKEELRQACRDAGVSYSKLTNEGMRDLLKSLRPAETDGVNNESDSESDTLPASANPFSGLMGQKPPVGKIGKASVKIVEGAKVDPDAKRPAPQPRIQHAPAPVVPKVSRKGIQIQKERETRVLENGKVIKRPSDGTVCGQVWAAFDEIAKERPVKASELPALADSRGWNRTNVTCEYYAWRRFNGIKGRSA